jgi:hypothetical protein
MRTVKIKNLFLSAIYIHALFAQQAYASSAVVYIQSTRTTNSEFSAFVKNSRSGVTLSDFYLETSPTAEDRKTLLAYLETAQKEYVSGSLEKAKQAFEQLTKISRDSDWAIDERKTIFYAYLRLAQLTNETNQKQQWLAEAIRFDFELRPDTKLFPPPFRKEFQERYKEELANSKDWDTSSLKQNIVAIKINGKKYNTQFGGSIKLMNGQNRVVLFSNKNAPIIRVLNINQALNLTIPAGYFDNGSCSTPHIMDQPLLAGRNSSIYYSEDCIQTFSGGKWINIAKMKPRVEGADTANRDSFKFSPSNSVEPNQNLAPQQDLEMSQAPSSNTKYWLLGLLAAGAVAALALSSKESSGPGKQPTHQ